MVAGMAVGVVDVVGVGGREWEGCYLVWLCCL